MNRLSSIASLFCLLILITAIPVRAQKPPDRDIPPFNSHTAVSGYERPLLEYIQKYAPGWVSTRFDNLGNLIVTAGERGPNRLIIVPVDEYGYVISQIRADGFLRIHPVQSVMPNPIFHQFHEGQPIFIITEKGPISGVTACASTHLRRTRNETQRIAQPDDLWVDIGARSAEEVAAAGVRLLDPISLREKTTKVGPSQISGSAIAAQRSVFAVFSLLHNLTPENLSSKLTIAFTSQELFGRRGVDRLARELAADEIILITDGWAGTRLAATINKDTAAPDELGRVGKLGDGPIVVAGDNYWNKTTKVQRVPAMQMRESIFTGGPAFDKAKLHLIALPVLFAGTTVETVDNRDAEQLLQVLTAIVANKPVKAELYRFHSVDYLDFSLTALINPQNPPLPFLIQTYGVSTFEEPVAEVIKKTLPAWAKPETDARGNLILTVGEGKPHIVFAAHMDEIGYLVKEILPDGTATVTKQGGFYDTLFEAHPMLLHKPKGNSIPCVMAPRRKYSQATERAITEQDLFLYFGTTSAAETDALGVKVGDSVTMPKQFENLQHQRASGRSFDDRVGCSALIMALRKLDPTKLKHKVTFVWTVEEETGLDGAKVMADKLREDVDYVFAIDTFVSSDSPLESSRFANARIGEGAVVRAMDNSNIVPRELLNRVLAIANARKIPVQYGVTGGGNDGAVFTQYGAIDIPLSWPLRYSHSPAEVIDLRDLDALAELVRAMAEEF